MIITINKDIICESMFLLEEASKLKYRSVPCKGLGGTNRGFSCSEQTKRGKGTGNFFIHTHRARSKYYDDISKVPLSTQKFISSTG